MLCGLVLLFQGLPARAQPAPAPPRAPLDISVGFDGAVKIGVPVPLRVRVPPLRAAGPAEVIVDAPGLGPQAGAVVASTVIPFAAVPGAARVFDAPIVLSDIRRPLVARVLVSRREILRRSVSIDPALVGGRVLVALSAEHAGLASLHRLPGRVVVAYVDAEALPDLWQEYAGVDLLAIRNLEPDRLEDAQRSALLTWVRLGGHLLVIARPGESPPEFLDPILPAGVGAPSTVPSLSVLASRYGGDLPKGPYSVAALLPRPAAHVVRAGGVAVIASARAGWGQVTMWGFDPWMPPFPAWAGHLRLWAEALGRPFHPLVDVDAVAARLPGGTPLAPGVHVQVGAAIFGYIVALYLIRRYRPSVAGAAGSLIVVGLGLAVFGILAGDVRGRSTTLTEVTFLEQAPGAGVARAVSVGVVAVPYGGGYRVQAPPQVVAGPVAASGDVRVQVTGGGTVLTGTLPPGAGARAFQALGTVPAGASGRLAPDGRTLWLDLGRDAVRHAELRWRGRLYLLGNLPPGASARRLDPAQWLRSNDAELDDRQRAWIFQGSPGDAIIMNDTTPVLAGEIDRSVPGLALQGGGTQGQRLVMLLMLLERRQADMP